LVFLKWIRQNIVSILCSVFLLFLFTQISGISQVLTSFIERQPTTVTNEKSSYVKTDSFHFVKSLPALIPLSKKDLKNIFYTIVNKGWNDVTFYCPNEYHDCIRDMKEFSQDQDLLTHINNYVHPFHSFSNIKTTLSEAGEITIHVEYLYSTEMIQQIEEKVKEIIANEIDVNDSYYEQIKAFHDYIINHTKYDISRNEQGASSYQSYLAYGPLFEGYATCNGYTDVMAIFLSKLNLPNYKIATTPDKNDSEKEGHVWNAVYLDEEWLHLDLTWDDPVSKDGKDYLQHKYFLVDNEELKEADSGQIEITEHLFKSNIYLEFK